MQLVHLLAQGAPTACDISCSRSRVHRYALAITMKVLKHLSLIQAAVPTAPHRLVKRCVAQPTLAQTEIAIPLRAPQSRVPASACASRISKRAAAFPACSPRDSRVEALLFQKLPAFQERPTGYVFQRHISRALLSCHALNTRSAQDILRLQLQSPSFLDVLTIRLPRLCTAVRTRRGSDSRSRRPLQESAPALKLLRAKLGHGSYIARMLAAQPHELRATSGPEKPRNAGLRSVSDMCVSAARRLVGGLNYDRDPLI